MIVKSMQYQREIRTQVMSTRLLAKSAAIVLLASLALIACGKKDDTALQGAMPAMPVTVLELKATSVPISAESVAQTEGAKEVEIRPRWWYLA